MTIFDDRIQIAAYDKDRVSEINDYLEQNPDKFLRILWFKESADYQYLKELKNVRKLKIDVCQVELGDLDFLADFTDLTYLEICSDVRGKIDISVLKNLTKLENLGLSFQNITNTNDLSSLDNLSNLKELYFKGKFKKKSLSLGNFPNMQILSPQLTDINLSEVEQLKNLKRFNLYNQKITDLSGIEQLASVETVAVNSVRMDNQDILSPIFSMKKLETLSLAYIKTITDFQFIKSPVQLKKLFIWTLNGLTSIKGIENLTALEIYEHCGKHEHRNSIDFSPLTKLKNLQKVNIKVGTMSKEAGEKLDKILKTIVK